MQVLRILLLEDSLLDAELIDAHLREGGIDCQLIRVETRPDFVTALETNNFDLILADYSLPCFDGISALEIARTTCPELPFIFVSATLGEELAVETLKNGATDYVLKQRLGRLASSVERALREAKERRDRTLAEVALQQALQRLSFHVENSPLAVIEWDNHFRVARWCGEAEKIFGWQAQEVIGKYPHDWQFVFAEDIEAVNSVIARLLNGTEQRNISQNRNYTKNGSVVHCEWYNSALLDKSGKSASVLSLVLDITERKQLEAERIQLLARERQQANRLRKLAEASVTINSTLSLEEVLQLVTEKAREIIGAHQSVTSMTIEQNWAQSIVKISLSDKYAQWRDYDEPPDGSGIYSLVCRMQHPIRMTQAELEAHPVWGSFGKAASKHPPLRGWLAVPLTSRNGHNIGLIQLSDKYEGEFTEDDEAILVQLAQMASAAIDNAQLYREAQETNRIKDEFLAVLSHELRSPLNPILGWAKLLKTRKFDSATTLRALDTIERNAQLQTQLIGDLLDVSRILRGKLSLNISSVNLIPTIEAAIETVRLAADAKSIHIKFSMPKLGAESGGVGEWGSGRAGDGETGRITNYPSPITHHPLPITVLGDANRLQQVFWNLLSNAVKFTPSGGCVEVELEELQIADCRLQHEAETSQSEILNLKSKISYAQITVSDTGKGINPDFLPYVFDYFRQENSTTTRNFGGLGLGLAIVRYLVELHGGTVKAESPGEGEGATFTVKLPLQPLKRERKEQRSQETPHPSRLTPHASPLTGLRVLVVDDDADSRDFLTFVLEQGGAKVTTATSASEAIASIEASPPEVLVSDIGMPEEDGYMLIRQLRADEQGRNIPAIAITAYAREEDRQKAVNAGFQKHVPKPISPAELVAVVANLTGRSQY